MATVHLSDRILIDGEDVSDQVTAWRLDRVGRDVPTLVLELNAGTTGPFFDGIANVRVARVDPSVMEFLNAVDPVELEKMIFERDDMDRSPIAVALELLKELAPDA